MAITVVQSSNTGTISATAQGNLLVVWIYVASTAVGTVSDNKSSSYTYKNEAATLGCIQIAYVLSTAPGITTITSTNNILHVKEYTGGGGGVFSFDKSVVATGALATGTAFTAAVASTTPSAANELICYGVEATRNSGTATLTSFSTPTSFTSLNTANNSSFGAAAYHWIQTTATATTASSTVTWSASTGTKAWNAVMACFAYGAAVVTKNNQLSMMGCGT